MQKFQMNCLIGYTLNLINLNLPRFINLGDLLEGSGWTHIISSSNLVSSGKVNAILPASSNIVLCRYIHQVISCALYAKKADAYQKYVSLSTELSVLPMSLWEKRESCHFMFKFWNLVMQFELLLFEFVKLIRSGNLAIYINTLMKIVLWVFALDNYNYARLLPVPINEMSEL